VRALCEPLALGNHCAAINHSWRWVMQDLAHPKLQAIGSQALGSTRAAHIMHEQPPLITGGA